MFIPKKTKPSGRHVKVSTRDTKRAVSNCIAIVSASAFAGAMAIPAYAGIPISAELHAVTETAESQTAKSMSFAYSEHGVRDSYTVVVVVPPPVAAASGPLLEATQGTFHAVTGEGGNGSPPFSVTAPATSYSGSAVVSYAAQFVGVVPYGNGNDPSDSFACDGYTQYVFKQFGIYLPRGADSQASLGTRISQIDAVAGDLVWWPGQHIGIYDGNGGYYHSPDWGRYVEHSSTISWGSPSFIRIG